MRQALQAVTVGDRQAATPEGLDRRALIAGAGAVSAAALSACDRRAQGPASGSVLAAGQPAAVLIYALAPERLAGWPRRPSADGLAALPPGAARIPEVGALTTGGRPADLESLAALRPGLVMDYGDLQDEHAGLAARFEARLGVRWLSLDGALTETPQAIMHAGEALGSARAGPLADAAADVLARWRRAPAGPDFYYARGGDGLETAFAGALATQVLEGAGWTNRATGGRDVGRVSREQVAAWDPEAIITLDLALARRMASDPFWRRRRNGARRRILRIPDAPFGWIDRPPSINRLLGCLWAAGAPHAEIRTLSRLMFQGPGPAAAAEWLA